MKISLGKKGFFLTMLAIVLSALFVTLFSARLTNLPDYKIDTIEGRVTVMNYYLESFYSYAKSAGTISGYAALQSLQKEMYSSGGNTRHYLTNFTSDFVFCAKNGTTEVAGSPCTNMDNKSFEFLVNTLADDAQDELKIRTQYIINNMTVAQTEDPFFLEFNINMTVQISEAGVGSGSIAYINSTRNIVSYIPIEGLYDPIYLVNGTYNMTITRANMSKIDGTWVALDLVTIWNTSSYRFTRYGITFFHRMQGNFTPSGEAYNESQPSKVALGIESFINHTQPSITDPSVNNSRYSFVDYLYWNKTVFDCKAYPLKVMKIEPTYIPGVPPDFQLDALHAAAFFNLTRNASTTQGCQ